MRTKSVARSRRSGTEEMRKTPANRPSHSAGTPAKKAGPSAVACTAPSAKRMTTARSTSPRLHQIRERLPTSIATVSTGTAERMPIAHATSGSMMMPVPNPATPPTIEPTSAPTIRTAQPIGSGMSCHHTRNVSLGRRRGRAGGVARLHDEHRVSGDRGGARGPARAGALDHHLLRPDVRAHVVRRRSRRRPARPRPRLSRGPRAERARVRHGWRRRGPRLAPRRPRRPGPRGRARLRYRAGARDRRRAGRDARPTARVPERGDGAGRPGSTRRRFPRRELRLARRLPRPGAARARRSRLGRGRAVHAGRERADARHDRRPGPRRRPAGERARLRRARRDLRHLAPRAVLSRRHARTRRIGGRHLLHADAARGRGRLAIEAAGLAFLGFVDGATPLWLIGLALFVAGFGIGFFEVPNMTTVMAAFPAGRQGAAGGLAFLTRTLGVVVGVALLGELVAARSATVGFLGAFEESLRASALSVAAAFLFALAGRRARR